MPEGVASSWPHPDIVIRGKSGPPIGNSRSWRDRQPPIIGPRSAPTEVDRAEEDCCRPIRSVRRRIHSRAGEIRPRLRRALPLGPEGSAFMGE